MPLLASGFRFFYKSLCSCERPPSHSFLDRFRVDSQSLGNVMFRKVSLNCVSYSLDTSYPIVSVRFVSMLAISLGRPYQELYV